MANRRSICFANHKGGVGKTTCTATVADAMARQKQRVLAIDMDPQANLTKMLTGGQAEDLKPGMVELLTAKESEAEDILASGIIRKTTVPGVSLFPSSLNLDYVANDMRISALTSPALYLRRRLTRGLEDFDFILIDTPPTMNLLTLNALAATDSVIIPFLAGDSFGLGGVGNLVRAIEQIRDESINPKLQVMGAVLTAFDGREVAHQTTEAVIERSFPVLAKVPRSASMQRGSLARRTVLQEDGASKAAREFVRFTSELLQSFGVEPMRRGSRAVARAEVA